ncbi:MAG: general stress protein [Bacteroidetes bacterium]|jgi:pyridoxine/pyridoxamine 5'-phosphate oxidase|nr:general stress protein [Bacteroidota bacterium]
MNMLLDMDHSKEAAWQAVKHELHRGALDRKHPFRFVTLSTHGARGVQARWVVLRKLSQDLRFFMYSDLRTQKVADLATHPQAHLLFYHGRKKVQIRCEGEIRLHHGDELSQNQWEHVQGIGTKAYTSTIAPGTEINHPKEAHQWSPAWGGRFFCVLEFLPAKFDVLQLNQMEHVRICFRKADGKWVKTWIAP